MAKYIEATIEGEPGGMLMHSTASLNVAGTFTKELNSYTGKKNKTEEDEAAIRYYQWMNAIYWNETLGVYLPSLNIEGAIWEASKLRKRGKQIRQALIGLQDRFPLTYDGPKDRDELYKAKDGWFVDVRPVRIGTSRVMRCRPIFREWSCTFQMSFMPDILEAEEIKGYIITAGRQIGIGDYRPRYGHFTLTDFKVKST